MKGYQTGYDDREADQLLGGGELLLDPTNQLMSKDSNNYPLVQISRIDRHNLGFLGSAKANSRSKTREFGGWKRTSCWAEASCSSRRVCAGVARSTMLCNCRICAYIILLDGSVITIIHVVLTTILLVSRMIALVSSILLR